MGCFQSRSDNEALSPVHTSGYRYPHEEFPVSDHSSSSTAATGHSSPSSVATGHFSSSPAATGHSSSSTAATGHSSSSLPIVAPHLSPPGEFFNSASAVIPQHFPHPYHFPPIRGLRSVTMTEINCRSCNSSASMTIVRYSFDNLLPPSPLPLERAVADDSEQGDSDDADDSERGDSDDDDDSE